MTAGSGDRVRRVDERLGLAVRRASLSGRSLVTYARDHVSVRTPAKPDLVAGNALDLIDPPAPADLPRWVERFADTIGRLGVRRTQVRWEVALPPDAPAQVPVPDPDLASACAASGLILQPSTVLLLGELATPTPVDAQLVPVPTPLPSVPDAAADRRWHAAQVLLRYEAGDTPDDWRAVDAADTAWRAEVERELAAAGRARVWLARRHGGPAARLSVVHDRQGLAVVEDVVTHPVHRRLGIVAALIHAAVADHLATDTGARVGVVAEAGGPTDHLARRLGFVPHATVWRAITAGGDGGGR